MVRPMDIGRLKVRPIGLCRIMIAKPPEDFVEDGRGGRSVIAEVLGEKVHATLQADETPGVGIGGERCRLITGGMQVLGHRLGGGRHGRGIDSAAQATQNAVMKGCHERRGRRLGPGGVAVGALEDRAFLG